MKKITSIVLCLLLAVGFSVGVMAADKQSFAKLTKIEGNVLIKRGGGERKFRAINGMKIRENDTLITSGNGSVVVIFANGNKTVVGKDTEISFEKIRKSSKGKNKVSLFVKCGNLFNDIKKKLTKGEKFEVRTPNSIAGVRGTQFYVIADENGTKVIVLKGVVSMSSIFNKAKRNVRANEASSISNNGVIIDMLFDVDKLNSYFAIDPMFEGHEYDGKFSNSTLDRIDDKIDYDSVVYYNPQDIDKDVDDYDANANAYGNYHQGNNGPSQNYKYNPLYYLR